MNLFDAPPNKNKCPLCDKIMEEETERIFRTNNYKCLSGCYSFHSDLFNATHTVLNKVYWITKYDDIDTVHQKSQCILDTIEYYRKDYRYLIEIMDPTE